MQGKWWWRYGLSGLIVLLIPTAAYLGWLQGRTSGTPVPQASLDTPDRQAPVLDASASRPSRASAASDAPLPLLATPLRDSLATLRQRADAGEPAAACRLAAEFEYCQQIRYRLAAASEAMQDQEQIRLSRSLNLSEEARRNMREMMAANSERLLKESEHCRGVPLSTSAERVHYWRQAALGGSMPALRHYAVGNAFRNNETLENLDALGVYRREAEALAWRGVASGDLLTGLALASALSPQRNELRRYFLAQAVQPDKVKALALYLHLKRQLESAPVSLDGPRAQLERLSGELLAELDASAQAKARELAAGYARDWAPMPLDSLLMHPSPRQHGTPDTAREECARLGKHTAS
jgi:hypothetical protein